MPTSPHIVIQKESAQTQIQRLQQLLARNANENIDLWAGYQYIAANITQTAGWDQRLVGWFNSAAEINGPGAPFLKRYVFGMNDEASRVLYGRSISNARNQAVSNDLARTVISDYIHALQAGSSIAPQTIFERDVGSAVTGLDLPPWAWAGGLFGPNFGFNLDPIYTTNIPTALFRQNFWIVNSDTVVGRIIGENAGATGSSIEKTLRALRKRFFGISLYSGERVDSLSGGVDGFAAIPGLVNATYTYFETNVPQQASVQVLNDDGTPSGPAQYGVYYTVGPTFALQISTPRGTSNLTSSDWTSSSDQAAFSLNASNTSATITTSSRGGAAAQKVVSASVNGQDITNNVAIATNLTGVLSNSLSRFIAGSNPIAQIATGTVLQSVGLNLAQAIAQGGIARDITFQLENGTSQTVRNNVLSNFGQEVATAFQNAAIGSFSALLTTELGRALGINGFGAELFNTAAGTGAGAVIGKVISNINTAGAGIFDGISLSKVFASGVPDVLSGALGSFFGAKLGSLVVSPTNTEGAILSSVGSAAGAWATGAAGGKLLGGIFQVVSKLGVFGGPFVGAFVGFVLGALIGKLFGKKKPRVPTANAVVNLDLSSGYYVLGGSSAANGGNRDLVVNMATSARDILNGLISVVVGGTDIAPNANTSNNQTSQSYGHTGNQIWASYRGSSQQNFGDAAAAVEFGVLRAIKDTRIRGGDLMTKRAISVSLAKSSVALAGDLQIAADYTFYLQNRERVNQLIQAAPTSALAATWAATLARAADLGLNRFQISDFYGGLQGFVESFGFGKSDLAYEAISIAAEGAGVRISTSAGGSPFELLAGSNNVSAAGQSVLISNFGANVGYTQWTGQATAGNDIWIASAGGAVTMDDSGYVEEWRWNPWDYSYEPYYTYVTGGDDIFVGSAYGDTIYGRAGWDWLDGGAGDDFIDGGDNDDVLLGRSGNDRLLGGSGNDYLAGGDGDDYFYDANRTWGLYGGDGNDVLVGGAGSDALYGENGDDIFIVDEDGGSTWDALTGQGGSDTLSYERFTFGVYIDFANLGGWSWDPTAKYIYGDAIAGSMENVTGSRYNDIIFGDAGANILRGLLGNDQLSGRDGDDILEGGEGADSLDGGSGFDKVSYTSSGAAVVANLTTGIGSAGDASGDTYTSVEGIIGSKFGDELTGSSVDDSIEAAAGDDVISLTGGNDWIDGGAGRDTLDARNSAGAVSIYYDSGTYDPYYGYYTAGAGWIASSSLGTTSFNSIETFVGSKFDDYLSGSAGDESFEGGSGNDVLSGGGGSDAFLIGRGSNNDTIYANHDGNNSIVILSGLNWRDIGVVGANYNQQGGNLVVSVRPTGDQAVVSGNFSYVNSGAQAGIHNHSIKTINLGWMSSVDIDMVDWTPDAAYEWGTTVYGAQNRSDLIFAYGGDDTIYTAGGGYESRGNVVYAGDGNDTIFASAGDDQYIFERGNGVDTVYDDGGADTIVMGPSVAADDVIYEVVANGGSADLYIGIRDTNNPNATASQVSDRIRVVGGGMKYIGTYYGNERLNTVEFVRVGGQEIDLTKANVNWAIGYEDDGGYYGGGDGDYGGGGGGGGYNIPPLAIDLDGDGIELRSVEGSRIASIDADGTVTRMGWLGQDDGFLALDRDGNGVIDRIGEISFASDVKGARTDLEGLAAYDSNGDGKLDASDKRWGEFKVWQDKNQDGFGSKNELVTLDKAGITYINLKGTLTGFTGAGTDGFDNTVVATTEIGWADKTRTGQGYDVLLARLQVRTDGGAKDSVLTEALARAGIKADSVEALLHGNQALTEEQVKALREQRAKGSQVLGEGGLLYRIEDLMGSSAKPLGGSAAKTVNGLLSIDPSVAQKVVAASRALGFIDRYVASDWTKLGSIALGKADARLAATVTKRDLATELKGLIKDARKIVAERRLADEAKTAAIAAKDAADSVLRPITPPTAAELEQLKQLDKFRLIEGADDNLAAAEDDDALDTLADELMRPYSTSADVPMVQDAPVDQQTEEVAAADTPATPEPVAATETADAPTRSTAGGDLVSSDNAATDVDAYGVVIRTANARLVQALASFGDAPAMMASYQGLNVANDAQAAWLSVDAMPSVQRLAAIR